MGNYLSRHSTYSSGLRFYRHCRRRYEYSLDSRCHRYDLLDDCGRGIHVLSMYLLFMRKILGAVPVGGYRLEAAVDHMFILQQVHQNDLDRRSTCWPGNPMVFSSFRAPCIEKTYNPSLRPRHFEIKLERMRDETPITLALPRSISRRRMRRRIG